ncbi:MAG: serine hydrolase [Gammaproteobacteria bacterium]|nr:serine hydrolase [Gammaproteobacteria bacterium]
MLKSIIEKAFIPGASMATISSNGDIESHVAGVAKIGTSEAITHTTIFQAASLSKPVFAYIVLKMAQRKELDLDTPLYKIFPDFGPPDRPDLLEHRNYKMLTARMILSHQSGLPNWLHPGESEYIANAGEHFNYSGEAFCFLNDVIEHITKKKLEMLAQEVFADLGMHHSSFLLFEISPLVKYHQAIGHYSDGKPDERKYTPLNPNPAASLHTTAEDYAKFLTACMNDEFIKTHMFAPQIELLNKDSKAIAAGVSADTLALIKWGIGVGLQTTPDGSTLAFHWGDNGTYKAFFAINLKTKQAAVCFMNSENGLSIFRRLIEPAISADLSAVSRWLEKYDGLKLHIEPKISSLLSHSSFFGKLAEEHLKRNHHEHPELQHEHDKRFGLVIK